MVSRVRSTSKLLFVTGCRDPNNTQLKEHLQELGKILHANGNLPKWEVRGKETPILTGVLLVSDGRIEIDVSGCGEVSAAVEAALFVKRQLIPRLITMENISLETGMWPLKPLLHSVKEILKV